MIKVMLLIILSPLAILCGILSIAIICAVLDKAIETFTDFIKTIINRGNNQC